MSEQKPNEGRAVVPSPAESGKSQPVPSGTPNAPRTSRASGTAPSAQRAVAVAAPNAVQPRDTFAHPAYAGSGSDFDFMRDMQQAMVNDRQKSSFLLLVLMVALLVSAAIWAHYSKLEEITKGDARIIASSREQVIQSLEGGILAEMLVREDTTMSLPRAPRAPSLLSRPLFLLLPAVVPDGDQRPPVDSEFFMGS